MKNIFRAIVLIALFSLLFASTAPAKGHHGGAMGGRGMGSGGRGMGMGGGMDTMGMGMRGGQAH